MRRPVVIITAFLVILVGGIILLGKLWQVREKNIGSWICKNGQWEKQGEPQTTKPTWECQEGEKVGGNKEQELVFDEKKFEKSKQMAYDAAKDSSTYKFDGYNLKFESSKTLNCSNCWEYIFSFSSRQAGYGDRTGQVLAQVITPHEIRVTVQDEKVILVVTDRAFDELKQIYLK